MLWRLIEVFLVSYNINPININITAYDIPRNNIELYVLVKPIIIRVTTSNIIIPDIVKIIILVPKKAIYIQVFYMQLLTILTLIED